MLQISHPIKKVHDAVNIHLLNFEKLHRDHFYYDCVKEGFQIQRFQLHHERRPHFPYQYDRGTPDLGSIRLRSIGRSLTELVFEDSRLLDIGPDAFLTSDVIQMWDDDEGIQDQPKLSKQKRRQLAASAFERFKAIHEEVRESIVKGLRDDHLLSEPQTIKLKEPQQAYVDKSRIADLKQVRSPSFDLTRLIVLCDELNKTSRAGAYCATAVLVRAIIDHVPPLFGVQTFAEVANNIGSRSVRKSLLQLENSSRNIADSILHQRIRKREVVPTRTQANFSQELDVLLGEIVRRLND